MILFFRKICLLAFCSHLTSLVFVRAFAQRKRGASRSKIAQNLRFINLRLIKKFSLYSRWLWILSNFTVFESTCAFELLWTSCAKLTLNFILRLLKFGLFFEILDLFWGNRLMKKHTSLNVLAVPASWTFLVWEITFFSFFVISTGLFELAKWFRSVWSHHHYNL
jgi:hypothetical protein